MKPSTSATQTVNTGNQPEQNKAPDIPANEAEKEMAWAIRGSINRSGRYSYEVDRLSLGFAAGKGISTYEARKQVESIFQKEMQLTPKQYLERHRQERGLKVEQSRGR